MGLMSGFPAIWSRPSRARELKLLLGTKEELKFASRPSRARELKRGMDGGSQERGWSRPSRARELKLLTMYNMPCRRGRAPRGRVS